MSDKVYAYYYERDQYGSLGVSLVKKSINCHIGAKHVEIPIITAYAGVLRATTSQMSNPYIYAEAGITEQDINDYETANAVPDLSVDLSTGVSSRAVQDAIDEMYNADWKFTLPNGVEFKGLGEVFGKSEPKQCTCDSKDLFNYGCKCGGV